MPRLHWLLMLASLASAACDEAVNIQPDEPCLSTGCVGVAEGSDGGVEGGLADAAPASEASDAGVDGQPEPMEAEPAPQPEPAPSDPIGTEPEPAVFYTLTAEVVGAPGGVGSRDPREPYFLACYDTCSVEVAAGYEKTLIAITSLASSWFVGWEGVECTNDTTSRPDPAGPEIWVSYCTFVMDSPKHVRAVFDYVSLSVAVEGNGRVGGTGIDCPDDCDERFRDRGMEIDINAQADPGWVFDGWSGACSGTSTWCRVTVNETETVTARFVPAMGSL